MQDVEVTKSLFRSSIVMDCQSKFLSNVIIIDWGNVSLIIVRKNKIQYYNQGQN